MMYIQLFTEESLSTPDNTESWWSELIYWCISLPSEYLCHVYVRNDNLSAVVIADNEYPSRVCFTLLDKVKMTVCS